MTSSKQTFQEKTDKLGEEIKIRHYQHEYIQHIQLGQVKAQLQFQNLELARSRAKYLRQETIKNLDTLLLQFEQKAKQRGIKVHWVENAEDAQHLIRNILHQKNSQQIIKAASPILQEVNLESSLQNQEIEIISSNLHEQIATYLPESIQASTQWILPHSSKAIAQAIEHKDGQAVKTEQGEIQEYLHKKFLNRIKPEAVGILGADFMVADTGSLSFSDDEGNIQSVFEHTSRQIVVMSLSQIIAKMEDLELFLILKDSYKHGKNQVAQYLLLQAPLPSADGENTQNLDLIILDNGRTHLYQDQNFREALECIHCEACASACPVVPQLSLAQNQPYPGAIGAILKSANPAQSENELLENSTLCGACAEACPIGIPLPDMMRCLRAEQQAKKWKNPMSKFSFFKPKKSFMEAVKKHYFSNNKPSESFYSQRKKKK